MKNIIEKFKSYSLPKKITIIVLVSPIILGTTGFDIVSTIFPLILYIFLFPLGYVLFDKNLKNEQKVGWLLLVFFFSWLAFAFYLIKKKD